MCGPLQPRSQVTAGQMSARFQQIPEMWLKGGGEGGGLEKLVSTNKNMSVCLSVCVSAELIYWAQ